LGEGVNGRLGVSVQIRQIRVKRQKTIHLLRRLADTVDEESKKIKVNN